MVFENIVVYLLDKFLGDYIENLDTKKLKIDLWSGNVVLENLYMKTNALASLNLPVTISVGYLEKLILQVPWKNIYTHPTKATIDGVYLLVVPKTEVQYDAKRDEREQHETKMKEVRKVEELRKEKEAEKNNLKTNDTFVERMQLQVIRNLELSIRNVHIVYEDRSTKPHHPFAFGITLNFITLHTTTADWQPTMLKEDTPLIHKLGELSAFSIYWNTNAKSRSDLPRAEAIKNLKETIAIDNQKTPIDMTYILRPLNVTARIILAMKPRQENFQRPMFDIKVDLDEISLNMNRDQYSDFLDLLEFQEYLSVKSKYIKYQISNESTRSSASKRWKFAYEAIVNEEIRPHFDCYKWENIRTHLARCREYRSIHLQELTGKLTNEQKERAEELEKKLDVFNLTFIRRSAEIEAKKKKEQEPKSWWGSVSNWWGGNKNQEDPNLDLEKVMSPEEKQKLFEAIGYAGEDTSTTTYPEEFIDIDVGVRLNMLDVNIWSKVNPIDDQFRVIARGAIPETVLAFKRRPATDAIALSVGLGSFQVFGISTNINENELSNYSRPVLAQPSPSSSIGEQKLLEITFETNPLDKKADYRVQLVTKSLEIKYNAPTINKLAEYFEPDSHRNLEGVKQVAYSTYTDVKHRSFLLMKHNLEKIKVLDIDLDIASSYFLLPENGIFREGCAVICMDLGHLTLKRGVHPDETTTDLLNSKDINDLREMSYTQFKLKLEDIQLIYANRHEHWERAREEKNTRLHLIKPMSLEMDVDKCIYNDDAVLPAWKITGSIPAVELRLSDKRLFQIINHIQMIPFPDLTNVSNETIIPTDVELSLYPLQSLLTNSSEQIYETVEELTPTKSSVLRKKPSLDEQLTQLEAIFCLDKIDLHIDEVLNTNDENDLGEPFLRFTLESIVATTKIKTFDMEFEASLADLIVFHEQFIGKDQRQLRLLSAELTKTSSDSNEDKFIYFKFLHTSEENPLFKTEIYDGIENRAQVHLSKLVVILQLEALLSILRFQDALLKKLPIDETKTKKPMLLKPPEDNRILARSISTTSRVGRKNEISTTPTLKIQAHLEEFRIVIASKVMNLFDIHVQGVKADVSQATEKTLINLILTDLRVFDPYEGARHRKIISQQGDAKELLRVDLTLFNYPDGFVKPLDVADCHVYVQFAKANIIFLFKHIDAILTFLDSLNITKAALDLASVQADAAYEQVQKLQEQAFKVHLDITFNAPNIIIPTNSFSDEALLFDLGRLTLKTKFFNDPKRSLVEQQTVRLENVLASRVCLDRENQILGEIILLECAELNTLINRLLYPEKVKNEPAVSIKVEWDLVHFRLSKDDYSCVMKVLLENFTENIRDEFFENDQIERYFYRQEEQEKEEEALRDAVIQKQREIQGDEIVQTVKIRAEIKKVALTLYLGDSSLTTRRTPRDEDLKLANVQIEQLEALFRQQSDSSYKAMARVKNFLLDDLRQTNKPTSLTRMMDRHFSVDPNAHMLVAAFEFKPKSPTNSMALRQLSAQLESLFICISLDYLLTLQDFFISGLPTNGETKSQPKMSINSSTGPTMSINVEEIETRVDVIVKHPEVILLVDQHDANSNCLVLDMAMQMRMITVGEETKIYGWLKDLTVYSSNFGELKDSKVKYRILQPAKADIVMIMDDHQQKVDIRISDIIVSIAPAAVRTLIGVTSSLGTLQTIVQEEKEKVNSKSMFNPKLFKNKNFWFTKDSEEFEENLETTDLLETVTGHPSQNKAIKQEENRVKEKETKKDQEKSLMQQLIFTLETIEIKLEAGLGSVTKSVVALCLSNLTADLKNWSNDMSLSSTVNVEAALFNERMLAWEPLIEPTTDASGNVLSPWRITCSIVPQQYDDDQRDSSKSNSEHRPSAVSLEHERKEGISSSNSKQIIFIRADQLLNITLTKTGLDLVQRLSALFNDVYNKRLPMVDDDDQPMLSLINSTGREISIGNFDGVEIDKNPLQQSIVLQPNESIALNVPNERQSLERLSVIVEQDFRRREEFSVMIGDVKKIISINRTWKRVYDLGPSANPHWPIRLLSDTQTRNNRRRVILSSIVKIYNNTSKPLIILDIDSIDPTKHRRVAKIPVDEEFYLPFDLIHHHATAPIFISVDENQNDDEPLDFVSFDWENDFASERKLKSKDGNDFFFVIFKEVNEAYTENTDQLDQRSFSIYVHPALHLTNLLPFDVQCSIDNVEQIDLKPSQLNLITSGGKNSVLVFMIPSYDNVQWRSDPIDLKFRDKDDLNEHLVIFHCLNGQRAEQRMILRVDSFHESYRLLLFSPFWILNRTDLKLEFQIDNVRTLIGAVERPILICPEKYQSDSNKKGQIRLFDVEQNETNAIWSEKFSLDVIKSTGMASCKVVNDRTYMICVDIVTSSFGLTKLVTLSPSVVIINKSTIEIEVVETVSDKEQDKWGPVNVNQVIPFWPHNLKEGLLRVRYTANRVSSRPFLINQKHRTLLQMDDEERPAIYVEVSATEFDGVRVIFGDYKIGDAPLLIVNCLSKQMISFNQINDEQKIDLPAKNYVYYTWTDPLKGREMFVTCGSLMKQINLSPQCGTLGQINDIQILYATFVDGVQTVLLFAQDQKIIEAASDMPSFAEAMGQHIQMGISDIGVSIVNDLKSQELLYISLNKSRVIWTETRRSRVRPLSNEVNIHLEELYQSHIEKREANPDDEDLSKKKYHMEEFHEITFQGDTAMLVNAKGQKKIAKRQALDGLWIAYAWSVSNTALHIRINRVQIDNQLDYTLFPVTLHPIVSKNPGTDFVEKPFIELSVYESKTTRSNVMHFKYFKLLIQEFAVKIDHGLIYSFLAFLKQEKIASAPAINMETDLEQIRKALPEIIKNQIESPTGETEMYFDNIHLSPLKIHVSFSMHGSKPSEELLAEYPFVEFLLRTLNVAEVQDVVLRLGFYDRVNDRFTITKLTNEVTSHYQNQFMKQLHVLVFGLDVLGNPFGVIRGLAEGVESFFYEPYKGAIEGPMEFAEGVATGVRTLFGSAVGGAAGAFSKITGVLGKGLATLTFDEEFKVSRLRRKEPTTTGATGIAVEGRNVVMGFVDGVTGVVTKPVSGAKKGGATGFVKGLGKGVLGLVTRPTGGIVDFASTSLDLIKRTAQQEETIRRVRYPRHVGRDGLMRPYIPHEAMGFYILNRLENRKYAETDTYIAHITCSEDPPSWFMATSKRLLFITEISFLGIYEVDWQIEYVDLKEEPTVKPNLGQIQILTKEIQRTGTLRSNRSYGKMVKYRNVAEARHIVDRITTAMHNVGL